MRPPPFILSQLLQSLLFKKSRNNRNPLILSQAAKSVPTAVTYYFTDEMSLNKVLIDAEHRALILNSFRAALRYLEQLQDILTPSSLKSHVVPPFGTSFLGASSVG